MWIEILLVTLSLLLYLYWYITKDWGYFKARGITEDTPVFPFGSSGLWKLMSGKVSVLNSSDHLLTEFPDDKYLGTYAFNSKSIVVKDIEFAKRVLIKDFDFFTDRRVFGSGLGATEGDRIFDNFLTELKGDKWKRIRTIVSPVMTSGKLKLMIPHVDKCAQYLEDFLEEAATIGEPIDTKSVFGKFALDAIATSGFGIDHNSYKNPDSNFRKTALRMIRSEGYGSVLDLPKFAFLMIFPKLGSRLGISILPKGTLEFFAGIIRKTIESRRESGDRRNDIIDLLVDELKEDKSMTAKKDEAEDDFERDANIDISNVKDVELDMEMTLVSNATVFFFAGFDMTSTALSQVMYGLANNLEAQARVRQEIEEVIGDSKMIKSEHLQDLKYMDNFINESVRFYNIVPFLERMCSRDYKIPGTDFTIPKGMYVRVLAKGYADHCFANPNEFDPDNFNTNNNVDKFGFTGFGQGPRNCIGMRYAMMSMKLALVHTLRRFRVLKCDKTVEKLEFDMTKSFFKGGIWVRMKKI